MQTSDNPETINTRLFDLCRYMRSELLEAELITYEEYAFLASACPLAQGSGSPSPRRLENYDRETKKIADLRGVLKKIRKHPTASKEVKELAVCALTDKFVQTLDFDERPILFLDVDGVLNRCADSGFGLEEDKIRLLGLIVENTNPRIVISSTWRNTPHQMERLTSVLKRIGVSRVETTKTNAEVISAGGIAIGVTRYQEILNWLGDNGNPKNFAVLDDDKTVHLFDDKAFTTLMYHGLTPEIAHEVFLKLKAYENKTDQ